MRILLVEDHEDLGEAIEKRLRSAGHSVEWIRDGAEVIAMAQAEPFDAVALDLTLPNRDGIALLAELRREQFAAPILVITARSEIDDRVSLLDLGADDYLVKPFDLRELEARLRALIRRSGGQTSSTIAAGNLEMDMAGLSVMVDGRHLELGRREFRLLEIFVTHLNKVVPKERLMNQLFNFDESVSINALELHVSRLRRKLEGADIEIGTVRGVGYIARGPDGR
jgi:two-component system response regulator TctD